MSDTKLEFVELPIEQLKEDTHQPRKDFGTDGDKNRLLLSLKELGVQQPVAVHKIANDKYTIIDGHRRYRCAQELRWKTIPCRVYSKLPDGKLEKVRFETQTNRRSWRPLERSEALARLKETNGFKTNKEVADSLYISETLVSNSLQLRSEKENWKELMDEYELSESYRVEFVKLKPKLRPIREFGIEEIVRSIFERVRFSVIRSAKDFRTLGRIFLRATANEPMLYEFLKNTDMKVVELEGQTIQSGFSLSIEQVIKKVTSNKQNGIEFSNQEKRFLTELRDLLSQTV